MEIKTLRPDFRGVMGRRPSPIFGAITRIYRVFWQNEYLHFLFPIYGFISKHVSLNQKH